MSVYGPVLAFFPEQFRTVEYLELRPEVKAGYTPRTLLGTVRGVFQYLKAGQLVRENEVLSETERPVFWCKRKLDEGKFIRFVDTDALYRIKDHDDWSFEGGFVLHVLETVTGNTDEQEPFEHVDFGTYA